jgi:putative ubiquitin-RnfH superfamily antitoxin RatB of RatAB toxin-antitoxin module
MSEADTKRCVVAYATLQHQYLWTVDLPEGATVADALSTARGLAAETRTTRGTRQELQEIPWETAPVGIFGLPCDRRAVPDDGDRIEIYRALHSDPRERRRERVRHERRAKQS